MNTAPNLQHIEVLRAIQTQYCQNDKRWFAAIDAAIAALAPPSGEGVDEDKRDATAGVLNRLEGWGKAYPIDMFGPITDEEHAWLHSTRPGLMDRISAGMGRHMAERIAEDIATLRNITTPQSAPVIVTEEMIDAALIAWLGPPYSALDLEDPDYRISMQKTLRAALTTPPPASQEKEEKFRKAWYAVCNVLDEVSPGWLSINADVTATDLACTAIRELASPPSSAAEEHSTSASQYDVHVDGRDNQRQPQGTTSGSSPGYSRPSTHAGHFELDEGDRMTLRCALVSFSEELKRDGLGTDDHGVRMTAAYLARISRLLTRINNSEAECKTCNGLGIVGGVRGQTPESMEQVTENCPDCSDDVTAGGTSISDEELPGMWEHSDSYAAEQAKPASMYGLVNTEQAQAGEVRDSLSRLLQSTYEAGKRGRGWSNQAIELDDILGAALTDRQSQGISHATARVMLDSLDDFARMDCGVDAKGPREALERYINQQEASRLAGGVTSNHRQP